VVAIALWCRLFPSFYYATGEMLSLCIPTIAAVRYITVAVIAIANLVFAAYMFFGF
jgi:hypothetical protein